MIASLNSFKTKSILNVSDKSYIYYDITKLGVKYLPYSLKILLENLLRHEDGISVSYEDVLSLIEQSKTKKYSPHEIAYRPARILMQDFTGVPALVDLAAMRDVMNEIGDNPSKINPVLPVDLVIDHSLIVDEFGNSEAFSNNTKLELNRNKERYKFLKWSQKAFSNFRIVPPGTGICHQVNLEYLAQTVWTNDEGDKTAIAYPDTLVGTDSHTTMINALGVLGWGVGGIEAESSMLGQPLTMLVPEVIGFKLTGEMPEGATATDLVLKITQMLRAKGVVGKFVEFYGSGLNELPLADRATIANMAPEYGAFCGFFPIDVETISYLRFTGRDETRIELVEAYAKAQGMWRENDTDCPKFNDTIELDISTILPSIAGPKRPQDRVLLTEAVKNFQTTLKATLGNNTNTKRAIKVKNKNYQLNDGDVVIAAITSCTNTSNPSALIAAGLVAQKAIEKNLMVKPWVKTSLAPGSQVVTDYLKAAGLQNSLDKLGFNLVGYGCTTCIGNSGPLNESIKTAVENGDLTVCAVLSGNRNFEGRINHHVKASYLASPPLVVAYALAGSLLVNLKHDPIGEDKNGKPVYLSDIWPSNREIVSIIQSQISPEMYRLRYKNVFQGDKDWQNIPVSSGLTYEWNADSTYVKKPPYFIDFQKKPKLIKNISAAHALAILGDSVTTDHISPAGLISKDEPSGKFLLEHQISPINFNSYGSRRGNHEIMVRGTFANIRLQNEMTTNVSGGITKMITTGEQISIFDASVEYRKLNIPLVVIAGKEYGSGSSRDWAAKGTYMLGIKAIIAESFERIHRSNLIGMGVLPLQFPEGIDRKSLSLTGNETFNINGISSAISPRMRVLLTIIYTNGLTKKVELLCCIDTANEIKYYVHGGILHYVLRQLT
ncbi:aconitate hydratase 1 [Candidatus Endolissoclinum faulkneri L2]|uniref:Aconitate hydratase n=1 Tax=Candidatus Endolissoclinum faulkneri L2 TaxID=1193729 RepID=K7YGE3_9PROT|nr:aconitate hydratase AcnA [Candidatus Endolissoclinum faulkneri]AFX98675.1 aconitate hydratase 1 [Candidatus Endolissoclinum faulkneri L2]